MPYPFQLPTTSATSLAQSLTSSTHPSLPLTATSHRHALRQALKVFKRTPSSQQPALLLQLLSTINTYLTYLLALDAGLSGKTVAGEEVDVVLVNEVIVEWKPVLSSSNLNLNVSKNVNSTSGKAGRVRVKSLESEIGFVLLTLGLVHTLSARVDLRQLIDTRAELLTSEQRQVAINRTMRTLMDAQSVFAFLSARTQQQSSDSTSAGVLDISLPVLHALSELTLAEATLIAALKDDPYPALLAETRSQTSKDWMFKAPTIPKARTLMLARVCLAAADHATQAQSMLAGSKLSPAGKIDDAILKYADDLRRTARGKAARLFGVNAEEEGKTGEGIAWLKGAKAELGFATEESSSSRGGFSKLKKSFQERREDKKIDTSGDWGTDGGRIEESRIVDMLEAKWVKMNDTIGAHTIPPPGPLLSNMPSGRGPHVPKPYQAPSLEEDVMSRMRAPADPDEVARAENEGDSDDDERVQAPGAFPEPGQGGGSYY